MKPTRRDRFSVTRYPYDARRSWLCQKPCLLFFLSQPHGLLERAAPLINLGLLSIPYPPSSTPQAPPFPPGLQQRCVLLFPPSTRSPPATKSKQVKKLGMCVGGATVHAAYRGSFHFRFPSESRSRARGKIVSELATRRDAPLPSHPHKQSTRRRTLAPVR